MIRFKVAKSRERGYYRVECQPTGPGTRGPNLWRCQCPGYRFRHTCRHIDTAQQALMTGVLEMTQGEQDAA